MMTKFVYSFDEGNTGMRNLLGGKGSNLSEMTSLGLPVPDGFTISTEACVQFLDAGGHLEDNLEAEILEHLTNLEKNTGKSFRSGNDLLLVSVRSGARTSMPGMMDTILNLGLNDNNVELFAEATGNPQFAYDCYRRLLQMFGNVVYGINGSYFENYLNEYKNEHKILTDQDLEVADLKNIIEYYKSVFTTILDFEFPQDPTVQLFEAIKAVFNSWNNERAIVYRSLNNIPGAWGTAVNIQEMVFGNMGNDSGTGVLFTRDPSTGENAIYGEYLMNAQGEDVVAGIRTPLPISNLAEMNPELYQEIIDICDLLENHYNDMQDIEFTIENNKLYLLQTRNGKRTAKAALKIAIDMHNEGLTTKEEALMKIEPDSINQLLHPSFDPDDLAKAQIISNTGLPASPGAAIGKIYFDAETAAEKALLGEKVILVRHETSPEDITGMIISEAIVTSRGGMTSHAAVVARGMGKCCVAGVEELDIDIHNKILNYPNGQLVEGDIISVDGNTGTIYLGEIKMIATETDESFNTIMAWARDVSKLEIRMNAETVADIETGLLFNAAGIGLARTEHMFFSKERLVQMRRFILSKNAQVQTDALEKIQAYQIEDFKDIFSRTKELPITIRLLDPPLHEFLPHTDAEIEEVAAQQDVSITRMTQRITELEETNPMLGHRGCRLAITYPELYLMQAEAIIRSAADLVEQGVNVQPEIMIPLVGMKEELDTLTLQIKAHLSEVLEELQINVDYEVGTMIELPRACLIADELAENTDFFSFGTNDLTQMTYGFSRDDAGKFINDYVAKDVLDFDPFQTLDVEGVGKLVETATKLGRASNPEIKLGVCGELGGDPKSIEFFHKIGLDYVSCSPFRIPIAQIAAAQNAIKYGTIKYEKIK